MARIGVNFGGWLVLERWMTPSLFKGTTAKDEYSFMLTPGAREKIVEHRKTYITEEDFKWLQQHRVGLLRLPVGYWVLEDDEPYIGARENLDWAMAMADKYGIDVIIDLHGHPGSQNGYDHSGQAGRAEWFTDNRHRERSLEVLEQIATRYRDHPRFWGLQLINEPRVGIFHIKLRAFYKRAAKSLHEILLPSTRIIFSDAFTPRLMSAALERVNHKVMMDVHLYHQTTLFAKYLSLDWFFSKTKRRRDMLRKLSSDQAILVGEWSGVLRGDVLKDVDKQRHAELFKDYVALQQDIFSDTVEAWCYWSYKTERPGVWNFRSMVERGDIVLPGDK